MDLSDIAAFVAVVEAGGFSEAARRKHTTKSALSRRVSTLEGMLGVPLLERQARGVRTNEVGAVFYAKCVRILEAVDAATDFASGFGDEIHGRLAVVLARDYLAPWLTPALLAFGNDYPALRLELRTGHAHGITEAHDPDLRIVTGPVAGKQAIVKPLGDMPRWLCASPTYLEARGVPRDPDALETHDALFDVIDDASGEWRLSSADGLRACRPRERLRSDQGQMLLDAAVAGLGVALLPQTLAAPAVAAGALRRVLPGWQADALPVSAVYNSSRRGARKIQLLLERLVADFPAPTPAE